MEYSQEILLGTRICRRGGDAVMASAETPVSTTTGNAGGHRRRRSGSSSRAVAPSAPTRLARSSALRPRYGVHDRRGGFVGRGELGDARRSEGLSAGRTRSHGKGFITPGILVPPPIGPAEHVGGLGRPLHEQATPGLPDFRPGHTWPTTRRSRRLSNAWTGSRCATRTICACSCLPATSKPAGPRTSEPSPDEEVRPEYLARAPRSGACAGQRQLPGGFPGR